MKISSNLLKNKKILLGVTGSIAVYKSLELVRLFVKAGADVKVVMSEASKKFVTPLSFETLTSNKVLDDTNESWVDEHNHIQTAQWADIFVIAPATANTIGKLANAIADNILLQTALAFSGTKILSPSANTNMLDNPITKANLKMLAIANYEIVDTQVKELACKTTGDGAMAEPINIFYKTTRELLKDKFFENRKVIVTGGGTIEKIDEVRYISNFSSGKMASALATALYCYGADVNMISTRFDTDMPKDIHKIEVSDSTEMLEYIIASIRVAKKGVLSKPTLMGEEQIKLIQKRPFLFMVAAVSDYIPKFIQNTKLKKELLGDSFELSLKQNIDILKTIDKTDITTIGFKAEVDAKTAQQSAKDMLKNKNLDAVCLNILKDSTSFGGDTNQIDFITKDDILSLKPTDKLSLSFEILNKAKNI